MLVLGLTGSIGMGKTTTAAMFAALGVPVYSADAAVHALYAGRAAPLIEAAFPGTVKKGTVDRAALSQRVVGDRAALSRLEALVHPLVREEETAFLDQAKAAGAPVVLLDIPLLFETGAEARVDRVVVVSAPADIQRARVLDREGMSPQRLDAILARQMPDAEKRRRADHVIDTGNGIGEARRQVEALVEALTGSVRSPSGPSRI
ncbi:dephospho-CoA kinase [Mangrovibrevibacter kandeliae]|uniref:dephospho-CoA kinase n=1 Tax=Mangrovibrevibacter kandeliae TaxID=2968473 RepID=UPI0021199585|nr:dephospho-CoA kinase [Aurantimonas sp. CSK15Z-1]MCQ8782321.1 dephospho-CoA kinase [Aurantimonas sp. CSK15Z-1]